MEILYDREVWDKRQPLSKTELQRHKASTELLTFRNLDKDSISSRAADEHSVSSTSHATASEAHPEIYKMVKQ